MSATPGKPRLKLPIGIQTFREIREEGHCYADKTPHIERLIERGKHYFLARPRRFGKSLLLDAIKELFEGSQALFRGLRIHQSWDWRRHPVVRLSFGSGDFISREGLELATLALIDTGRAGSGFTTPTTSCCCSGIEGSALGGSRPAPRPSWWIRWRGGAWTPSRLTAWLPTTICCPASTWTRSPPRPCRSKPAT